MTLATAGKRFVKLGRMAEGMTVGGGMMSAQSTLLTMVATHSTHRGVTVGPLSGTMRTDTCSDCAMSEQKGCVWPAASSTNSCAGALCSSIPFSTVIWTKSVYPAGTAAVHVVPSSENRNATAHGSGASKTLVATNVFDTG